MNTLSKLCLASFEIANELLIAVGAGVTGIAFLISHGYTRSKFLRTFTILAISVTSFLYVFQNVAVADQEKPSTKKIVLITGCDSGLGFSLALHSAQMGFTVVAGFLSLESVGAKEIKQTCKSITQVELDITNYESIFVAVQTITQFLKSNPSYEFFALVNNAAVMVFGEFEWQTDRLISHQISVNLSGTISVTRAFIPILRKYRARVINITSHCAYASLPGLSVYGATKSGVKAFSDSLRVELGKFGVKVIMFTPGSFFTQCNILSKHTENVDEMYRGLNREQKQLYDDYFQRYNSYLLRIPLPKRPDKIENVTLYKKFEDALLSEKPNAAYKIQPVRYAFYHWLFKISPTPVRDYFVEKFMSMPEFSAVQPW